MAISRSSRHAAERLEQALEQNGVPHGVKEYPEAGHAFMNEHAPGEMPLPVVALARLSRSAYHEPSARDVRRRIAACFSRHLGGVAEHTGDEGGAN